MKMIIRTALVLAVILIILGCVTPPPAGGPSGPPRYFGKGAGTSQTEALNTAKMDAVRKAVVEMIGVPASTAKRPELEEAVYSVPNANLFVINDSLELLGRERDGDVWRTAIMIQVDLAAVETVLRDNGIWGGKLTPGSPFGAGAAGAQGTPPPQTALTTGPEPKYGTAEPEEDTQPAAAEEPELTPEEREFLDDYVDRMIYMVYFDEESAEDPFLMKSAVTMANGYLAKQGVRVVDSDQIEELKQDRQLLAREGQAGGSLATLQRDAPCGCRLVGIGGAEDNQIGDGAQRGQMLDRLVGRPILPQPDRVVGPHVDHGQFHQGRQPHRCPHIVRKYQEGTPIRHHAAMKGHPIEDRSHRMLAHAEVKILSSTLIRLESLSVLEHRLV